MDRRTLIAVLISFGIFMGWQKFYIEPRTRPAVQQGAQSPLKLVETETTQAVVQNEGKTIVAPAQAVIPLVTEEYPLAKSRVAISNDAKFFKTWSLSQYHKGDASQAVDLESVSLLSEGIGELAFDLPEYAYLANVRGQLSRAADGLNWVYEDDNVRLERKYTPIIDSGFVDIAFKAQFKGKKPNYAFVYLNGLTMAGHPEEIDRKLLLWGNQSLEDVSMDGPVELKQFNMPVKWVAVTSRYFLATLVNQSTLEAKGLVQPLANGVGRVSLVFPVAGTEWNVPVRAYFGPKDLKSLRAVDPTLDHTVDFGWFTIFAYPLLRLMQFFYSLIHNWGVAIILLTLVVKILTYPLTYKSMKSMKEMAKIQPQLQKLREKYANDKEALNREMLVLMRGNGYNPLAGCLPILVQMPVFFALYRVLYSSIELYQAPFFGWIMDLSAKDPYYVTPILLSVTMYVQQKLQPNTIADPMQAKIMQFMPIMFGLFMITLPSGLTLYMLVNALAGIVQQLILNKKLDTGPNVQVLPPERK